MKKVVLAIALSALALLVVGIILIVVHARVNDEPMPCNTMEQQMDAFRADEPCFEPH